MMQAQPVNNRIVIRIRLVLITVPNTTRMIISTAVLNAWLIIIQIISPAYLLQQCTKGYTRLSVALITKIIISSILNYGYTPTYS